MDQLLEAIRAAIAADSTDEVKAAGASACRTILTALEAKAGEPMVHPAMLASSSNPIEAIASAVRGMPVEQLLDVAIARLRAALPQDANTPALRPLAIPLVPVPRGRP